ncbi:Initiation-specific alpha-16-mannosyltransferase protein [Rutstroemia sp. NJR-2017a BVV2]|nr:Initiation-specific alpha-16-mannosyltransferase protein [Rutstroemia sp. NJR-2017a BVV2]
MFLSNRRSALKSASTVTIVALVLFIFFFPSHTWHIANDKTITLPSPLSQTTTSAPKSTPSVTAIPEKIWYKLGPRGMTKQVREWVESCLDKNPNYKSEFMTDLSGDAYVKEKFAHRPDIVEAFLSLPFPILKADFLRYLLLFNEGGVYSDLDVSCNDTPIRDWIPAQYKKDASVVVGWEFDVGWGDGFMRQFATWTIMARPRSPHLLMVLDDIMEGLREKTKEYNVTIADMTWDMVGDVVDLTGPRRMTRSILKSLRATLKDEFDDGSIAAIFEPKLVGDVLILPGYSFALSSNHYKPEDTQGPALVTHHFEGSWKNDHGGQTADTVVL